MDAKDKAIEVARIMGKSVPGEPPKSTLGGQVLAWFVLVLIMGTIGGIWVKLFWLGWVFAP